MNKILLVDDVPGWVRFHKTNLEYLNFPNTEIDTAFSAKESLAKIEANIDAPFTAIFTDLQMESDFLPKYAGEWLVYQIKTYKEYKNSKIIIVSASPQIEHIANQYNVDFIPKPTIRNADCSIYKKFLN